MGYFTELVPIVARTNHNEGHVGLVCVLETLLFDFYRAADDHIVAVRFLTLIENPGLFLIYMDIICNLQQFLLHGLGVLHEESQFFA